MARDVLRVERDRGSLLTAPEVEAIFSEWYRNNKHLRENLTRDDYLVEFQRALTNAKIPYGETTLSEAIAAAKTEPEPPEASLYTDPKKRLLVSICWQLQVRTAPNPFFITCRNAATAIESDHSTTSRWLLAFCERRTGFLDRVKIGSFAVREGSEYLFHRASAF